MNLTDLLSGSVISSIAGQTGTSEKDTQNVLANALPALVGAMAQNASTEDGANSLAKALDDHTSSKGLASLLQNVDTEDGAKILTKILGGETETRMTAVPLSRWLAACWAAAIKSPVRATAATFLPAWRAAC